MRITDALREEHKVFIAALNELDGLVRLRADLDRMVAKASLLARGLLSHSHIEDNMLLRRLKSDLRPIDPAMAAEHREVEGALLETLLSRLANAEIRDPEDARDAVRGIAGLTRRHFAMEEEIVYPMVETILGESRLRAFGSLWPSNSSAFSNLTSILQTRPRISASLLIGPRIAGRRDK
jgi:hemerythrin-like domain-containing protein